jgi:hypothetical protein
MQKAIVLHTDILGFKKIIEDSSSETNDATLNKLKSILSESAAMLTNMRLIITSNIKLQFKQFSDNLYASFSYSDIKKDSFADAFEACILFARVYYETMLQNKLTIRGGISFGNDYSDETIIFSHALVKAYILESEKAKYPRIVIDDALIIKVQKEYATSRTFDKVINNSILKDQENIYFLNPCGLDKDFLSDTNELLAEESHRNFIKKQIKFARSVIFKLDKNKEEDYRIIKKYEWLTEILLWNVEQRQILKNSINNFELQKF